MNDQLNKIIISAMTLWRDWTDGINNADRDEGSAATETAIIVGVVAAAAVGLTAVIVGAINKFSSQIP